MKKRVLTILTVIFALVLGFAVLAACGGDEGGDSEGISINVSTASISVGEEKTLMVSSKNKTYTWTTSNDAVVGFSGATNRSTVRIKGVGKGEATVTATDGDGKRASCAVTVDEFKVEITGDGLANGKITLLRNSDGSYESKTLTAKVLRSGTATDEAVTWGSSAPAVVSVENGVLTAHGMGTATVTAKRTGGSAQSSVEVEVKWGEGAAPVGWYEILHGGENLSLGENAGKWVWTGDEGWGASTPTVTGDGLGDGSVTLNVEGNTGWRWYGVQLFYKNAELTAGTVYKLTFDVNSTEAGWITVNDTDVEIKKGANSVTVYYVEGAGDTASIHMNLATHDKLRNGVNPVNQYPQGTLSLTNLKWEPYTAQKLAAPTEFSVEGDGELKITDTNNDADLEGYVVGFFEEGKTEPSYTQPIMKPVAGRDILSTMNVKDGKMYLDDSFVPAGNYTLKVYAYSNSATHQNSDWSTVTVSRTVSHANGLDYKVLESYRDVDRGIGRYYVWSEWALFNLAKSYYRNNALTLALDGESSWYSNQVYYDVAGLTADHLYEYSFKMNAKDNEGNPVDLTGRQFVINGQRIDVKTGENSYKIYFLYRGGMAVNMLLGKPTADWQGTEDNKGLPAGNYTFSDIKLTDMNTEGSDAMIFGDNLGSVTDKLMFWYAAIGDWTNPEDQSGWTAQAVAMRSFGATANNESDTGYSYSFDYKTESVDNKICSWIVRFWYKNTQDVVGGKEYHVVLSITSSEEGDIMINGTKVHITTGTHDYSVYYDDGADNSLLSVTMATENSMMGMSENGIQVTFNTIKWVEGGIQRLTAPTGSLSQDGTVTITDPNNGTGVDHFELGLFRDDALVSTQNIANGGSIEAGKHQNGAYTVKLRACGETGYRDSDWTTLGSFTVTNGYNLDSRHEQDTDHAKDNPGHWYHWIDLGWEGGTVTPNKSDIDMENKTFTFGYTTEGWSNLGFSVQLYYKNPGNTAGKLYTFTADLKLSVNGTITVNGEHVELKANETKHVSIRYTETDLSISIQMGVYHAEAVLNGEITISNWAWAEVTSNPNGEAYDVVYTTKTEGEIPADSTFYYWTEYPSDGMSKVKYDHGTVSFDLAGAGNWYSNQIFYRGIGIPQVDGAYTFTMKIHSTVAGNIRVNGKIVTLKVGDNDITVENSNGMFSIQMGEPNGNWEGNLSTVAHGSFTLSDFLWTAADGTQYNLDGKVNK